MTIAQSRLYFKVQNFITPTIKQNFKSDQKFRAMNFVCTDCMEEEKENLSQPINSEPGRIQVELSSRKYSGYPDNQEHQIFQCQANADLREGKNIMENEIDCVTFFQQLLERRMNKLG